jgi:hypothetical protein
MMQNRNNLSILSKKIYFTNYYKFFYFLAIELSTRKLIT